MRDGLPHKAQDSNAAKALKRHLEKGATGRLTVGDGAGEVSVYVQQGAILAAESTMDGQLYVRRLRGEKVLRAERLDALHSLAAAGEPVFGYLVDEVPSATLDRVLYDRFVDNVARFLGSGAKPRFEFTAGVFVDNLQMGLSYEDVLLDAGALWDAASRVVDDAVIEAGPNRARVAKEARVRAALTEPTAIGPLLDRLPFEPVAGRALIATMLAQGLVQLQQVAEPAVVAEPETADVDEQVPPNDHEVFEDVLDDDTEMVVRPSIGGPPAARLATTDEAFEDLAASEDSEVIERVEAVTADNRGENGEIRGAGDLASYDAWVSHGVDIDDDLDAFGDHDEVRGGNAGGATNSGAFSTEQHNLDVVEVAEMPVAAPEPEVLEAEELPQAKFGAPTLTDEEASEKLAVANDVLASIAASYDEEQGNGGGRAALQLLLDGSPARFAVLFQDVTAMDEGTIQERRVIRNLGMRPPSEHRHLLIEGLVDLIERALSLAADELSDSVVDAMLERVAGYRQRMGR